MDEPMTMAAYNSSFYFGLQDLGTGQPLKLDPRYGSFKLTVTRWNTINGAWIPTVTDVGIKEVDMVNDKTAKKLLYSYDNYPHGIYTATDFS